IPRYYHDESKVEEEDVTLFPNLSTDPLVEPSGSKIKIIIVVVSLALIVAALGIYVYIKFKRDKTEKDKSIETKVESHASLISPVPSPPMQQPSWLPNYDYEEYSGGPKMEQFEEENEGRSEANEKEANEEDLGL